MCDLTTGYETLPPPRPTAIAAPVWQDRTIASAKLRLLEYSAFMESQKDRETVLCDNEKNVCRRRKKAVFFSLTFIFLSAV